MPSFLSTSISSLMPVPFPNSLYLICLRRGGHAEWLVFGMPLSESLLTRGPSLKRGVCFLIGGASRNSWSERLSSLEEVSSPSSEVPEAPFPFGAVWLPDSLSLSFHSSMNSLLTVHR
jgi:hypothetical protein